MLLKMSLEEVGQSWMKPFWFTISWLANSLLYNMVKESWSPNET